MKKVFTLLIVLLIAATTTWAQTVHQLSPFAGHTSLTVTGINDNGMVVGYSSSSSVTIGFKWTKIGGMVAIGTAQYPRAINNNGMIVGDGPNGASVYWLPNSTTPVTIAAAGTNGGGAFGINDNGLVVGRSGSTIANPRKGYIWNSVNNTFALVNVQELNAINNNCLTTGSAIGGTGRQGLYDFCNSTISVIGNTGSWAFGTDINNSGTLIGMQDGGYFVQSGTTVTPLAGARGINDAGQVVGAISDVAYIWESNVSQNLSDILNEPTWIFKYAEDINNKGWIIGTGTKSGQNAAFVFEPKPLPVNVYTDNTLTTWVSSHNTIQDAINAGTTLNGYVITVASGTYTGTVSLTKEVTLLGANAGIHPAVGTHLTETVGIRGAETILSYGNGPGAISVSANNVTIDGFKITSTGLRIIDTYADANYFTMKNCIWDNSSTTGNGGTIQFGGGSHTNMTLEFNQFMNGEQALLYTGGTFDALKIQYNYISCKGDMVFWTASALVDGIIKGNEIDGTIGGVPGVGYCTVNIGQAGNLQITDNYVHDVNYTAFQVGITGGSISGNKFEDVVGYAGLNGSPIQLWGGEYGTAVSTNVDITNNEIHYNQNGVGAVHGIRLRGPNSPTDPKIDASTIHVHNNSFLDGGVLTGVYTVLNQGDLSKTLDATCNWYGTTVESAIAAKFNSPANYVPFSVSEGGACTGGLPIVTNIETPTLSASSTCGSYDVDVTVQNFTDVANISLKLKIPNPALHYTGITSDALPIIEVVASVNTSGDLFSFSYVGDGITLSGNPVLFTLHFDLLPAASGSLANFQWDTQYARCQYSSPSTDVYAATFNDLIGWTLPARPVKNTTTLLEYCTIQAAINDNATLATHTLEVDAALYSAKEQVLVNKEVKIKGINGTPVVDFDGTVSGKPTLFDISANNVTIENIQFKVDLARLRSAIIASAAGIDNITIKDNVIDCYGTPAGTYGDRNAISINYGGPANYRIATGGVDNINFTGNTVNAGTYPTMFRAGIAVDEGEGTFSGNTLKTINQDIVVRFANSGSVTVSGNHSNGGGMEFVDFNAGTGTLSITGNFFDGTFANTYSNALRLRNNYTARPTVVSGNTFTAFVGDVAGSGGTLSLENYQAITLDANTFTPLAGSTTYRHITLNTKDFSSSSGFYAPVVGATFTNNVFNGSGTLGGTALAFYNWDNDAPVFNAITIGTAGNENTFNDGIGKFIVLDGSTGSTVAPITTMVPWAINLDAQNNKFATSTPTLPSAMTLAQLFMLEDKIDHKIDLATLGFVTVKADNDYVTVNSFVAPNTFALIQRGVDAASNGWTVNVASGTYTEAVNVNKSVILKGAQADNDARTRGVVAESVLNNSAGAFAIAADNVVINGFTIKDQTLSNSAPTWGYAIYMVPNHTGTQLLNNIIKNNIVGSSLANTGGSQVIIQYNWFDANNQTGPSSGAGIYTDEYVSGGPISNVLIDNNKFTGNSDAGMDFSSTNPSKALSNVSISNNLFDGNSRAAFFYNLISSSFINNTIQNSTGAGTGDVRIYGGVDNLNISNNYFINGVPSGIRITNDGSLGNSNISVSINSFTGYTKAIEVVSGYTGALSATCNWYGTIVPTEIAAKISGTVTYIPWLTDGLDTDPSPGFQPAVACDETLPVITCPGEFTTGVNDGITYDGSVGVALATDNGSVTITNNHPSTIYPIGTTVVTWTARDLAGNESTCNQNVIVTANNLSGTMMYNNLAQTGMNEIVLQLTDASGTQVNDASGNPVANVETATIGSDKGKYAFTNLRAGIYKVSVVTNENDVEFINSTDAGAANLWAANNTEIEYVKFLAGDVTNDLFVNGTDALRIQKYFVDAAQFPFDRGQWSYWKKEVKISDNDDAKPANFNVTVSGGDVVNFDIYAMVTGDFKGDYDGSYLKSAGSSLSLARSNQMNIIANQEFELPLFAGSAMEVGAISLILEIPSNLVEVQDVRIIGSSEPASWAVKGNELRIGWNSLNPISVAEKNNLLTLKLKASNSFNAGQTFDLALTSSPLNELADRNFDVVKGASLLVAQVANGNGVTGILNPGDVQALMLSNYPNPFKSSTTVDYQLPVNGKVTIMVYNQVGQLVKTLVDGNQNAGDYSIRMDANNLMPGIYIAKLSLTNTNVNLTGTVKLSVLK